MDSGVPRHLFRADRARCLDSAVSPGTLSLPAGDRARGWVELLRPQKNIDVMFDLFGARVPQTGTASTRSHSIEPRHQLTQVATRAAHERPRCGAARLGKGRHGGAHLIEQIVRLVISDAR